MHECTVASTQDVARFVGFHPSDKCHVTDDVFNRRLSVSDAAAMVEAAERRGLLEGARAAIFHDLALMRARIAALRAAFPRRTLHAVAIKANPLVEILREVVRAEAGLEAASIEEVELALAADCPAEWIVFDSPAKTVYEIERALELGIYLNVDNFDELSRVAALQQAGKSTSVVGLRVNAMVGGGAIGATSVSTAQSKFGVSLDGLETRRVSRGTSSSTSAPLADASGFQLPLESERARIVSAFAEFEWLRALHVHVGSQGCPLALLVEAAARMAELRSEIAVKTGRRAMHLDIGGGLSTVYQSGDVAPTPCEYRKLLEERAPDLFANDVELVTEFGRAIHANCGVAVSRVEHVKSGGRGGPLAVIHLGADFLLRPVYRAEDWKHEFFLLDRQGVPKEGASAPTTIAGPLCFAGDVVGRDVLLPPIEPGDWIVIRDVGAYTLSMWSRHCSRGIPAVLGYDRERADVVRVLRSAETPTDVARFWGVGGDAECGG